MGLFDMKSFYRFLEESSKEELEFKLNKLNEFIAEYRNTDSGRDAMYYKGKIEEELLSRIVAK